MAFAHSVATTHAFTSAERKPGFLSRMLNAMMVARQRQAEQEIARYLRSCGGKFTDEAERVIERRFMSNPR